jgi:hypothetical protein
VLELSWEVEECKPLFDGIAAASIASVAARAVANKVRRFRLTYQTQVETAWMYAPEANI